MVLKTFSGFNVTDQGYFDDLSYEQQEEFVKKMSSTVVKIETRGYETDESGDSVQTYGVATGVSILGGKYILTCYHGLKNIDAISVSRFSGYISDHSIDGEIATVRSFDETKDLAILELSSSSNDNDHAELSNTNITIGQKVYVIGMSGARPFPFTVGRVSSICNDPMVYDTEVRIFGMDAQQRQGSSGAPVFDASGKIIGICIREMGGDEICVHFSTIDEFLNGLNL